MSITINARRGRVRAALATGAGGCLLCALAVAVPADAATSTVEPTVDCVATSADGSTATAYFGYANTTGTAAFFPVGDNNQFFPASPNEGQPTTFNQGSFPDVVAVTYDPVIFPAIAWILDGNEADAAPGVSPQCGAGTTAPASGLSTTGATLNGVIDPGGQDATYEFEYGTTTSYGSATTSADAGSGNAGELVQATLAGLSPSTTYYFRLDTSASYPNSSGGTFTATSDGQQQSFTTPAAPVVTPPPPAGMALVTTALPAGKAGAAYSATLSATGGTKPYTWSVTNCVLPRGLRLDSKTGVISGKPLDRGTFKVTLSVTDSASPARESLTEQYAITIAR